MSVKRELTVVCFSFSGRPNKFSALQTGKNYCNFLTHYLRRHHKTVSESYFTAAKKKSFTCKECMKCFSRDKDLIEHSTIHIKDEDSYYKHEENHVVANQKGNTPETIASYVNFKRQRIIGWSVFRKRPKAEAKIFFCDVCGKTFSFRYAFIKHSKTHSDKMPVTSTCEICHEKFKDSILLKAHSSVHTNPKQSYSCDRCRIAFKHPSSLKAHMMVQCKKRSVICKICGKTFKSNQGLTAHNRIVHECQFYHHTAAFICDKCGKQFTDKVALSRHLLLHEGKKSQTNVTCGETFYQNSHAVNHSDKQNYSSLSFERRSEPRKHTQNLQNFTNNDIYTCTTCGKHFKIDINLLAHERTHEEEESFPYETQGKIFRSGLTSNDHAKTPTQMTFTCETCGERFKSHADLTSHCLVHKENVVTFPSGKCGEVFGCASDSDNHSKIFPNETISNFDLVVHCIERIRKTVFLSCGKCGITFTDKFTLDEHMKTHSDEVSFTCKTCEQVFRSNSHLMVHLFDDASKSADFSCQAHTKVSSSKSDLNEHSGIQVDEVSVPDKLKNFQPNLNEHRKTTCNEIMLTCEPREESEESETYDKSTESDADSKAVHQVRKENTELFPFEPSEESVKSEAHDKRSKSDADSKANHQVHKESTELFPCEPSDKSEETEAYDKRSKSDADSKAIHQVHQDNTVFFPCDKCERTFSFQAQLIEHFKSHSSELAFSCGICGASFSSNLDLMLHRFIHIGKALLLSCGKCGITFTDRSNLGEHLKTHCNETSFACKTCGQEFKSNSGLMAHIYSDSCKNVHLSCHKNQNVLSSKSNPNEHFKTQSDESSFVSDKPKSWQPNVNEHRKTTCSEIMFTCEPGEEPVSLKSDRIMNCSVHAKNVTTLPNYKHNETFIHESEQHNYSDGYLLSFDICRKNLKPQVDMMTHRTVHTSATTTTCDKCRKAFGCESDLNKHLRSLTNELMLACEICSEKFNTNCELIIHNSVKHGNRATLCDEKCWKMFSCESDAKEHVKAQSVDTVLASRSREKAFSTDQTINQLGHTERVASFPCHKCEKAFNCERDLSHHVMIHHDKPRDLPCEASDKVFKCQSDLRNHLETHCVGTVVNTEAYKERLKSDTDSKVFHPVAQENAVIFPCDKCERTFGCRIELAEHFNTHSSDLEFYCEISGESFKSSSNFTKDMGLSVHNENIVLFPCDKCQKKFCSESDLNEHLKDHSSEMVFTCEACAKVFKSNFDLMLHRFIHVGGKLFNSCGKCGITFDCQSSLTEHLKNHPDAIPFVCKTCRKVFKSNFDLLSHLFDGNCKSNALSCATCKQNFSCELEFRKHRKIHPVTLFTCQTCEKKYTKKEYFIRHVRKCAEDVHVCDTCGEKFHRKKSFRKHCYKSQSRCKPCMRQQKQDFYGRAGKEPLSCEICEKRFRYPYNLKVHLYSHSKEKRYKCKYCQKGYTWKRNYEMHILGHTSHKLFNCEICNKSFKTKPRLDRHMNTRVHTGAKKVKHVTCDTCGKKFRCRSALNRHSYSHSKEKHYKCEYCQKEYTWKESYKMHILGHTGHRPFSCEICNKRFKNKSKLRQHMNTSVHGGNEKVEYFTCGKCGKKFRHKSTRDRHAASHPDGFTPYMCETCGKGFTQKGNMKIHYKQFHTSDLPFCCGTCGKRFALKCKLDSHVKQMHEEKTFVCETCGKTFSLNYYLKRHRLRVHKESAEEK